MATKLRIRVAYNIELCSRQELIQSNLQALTSLIIVGKCGDVQQAWNLLFCSLCLLVDFMIF